MTVILCEKLMLDIIEIATCKSRIHIILNKMNLYNYMHLRVILLVAKVVPGVSFTWSRSFSDLHHCTTHKGIKSRTPEIVNTKDKVGNLRSRKPGRINLERRIIEDHKEARLQLHQYQLPVQWSPQLEATLHQRLFRCSHHTLQTSSLVLYIEGIHMHPAAKEKKKTSKFLNKSSPTKISMTDQRDHKAMKRRKEQ